MWGRWINTLSCNRWDFSITLGCETATCNMKEFAQRKIPIENFPNSSLSFTDICGSLWPKTLVWFTLTALIILVAIYPNVLILNVWNFNDNFFKRNNTTVPAAPSHGSLNMFFSGAGRDQGRAKRNTGHPETQMQLNDKGALCRLDV